MPDARLAEGQVLLGPLFPEPVRVETVRELNADQWEVGLVGTQTDRFRRVTLTRSDLDIIRIHEPACSYAGDGALLKLGIQEPAAIVVVTVHVPF